MFKVSIDEGTAFDMLAILAIKRNYLVDKNKKQQNNSLIDKLIMELGGQLEQDKLQRIIMSEEFFNLIDANRETFKLVELAKKSVGLANAAYLANMKRFKSKELLQEKFFNSKLSETKT